MTNLELAQLIEDEINKEAAEWGDAPADLHSDIYNWLEAEFGDDHDFDAGDLEYLKTSFELDTL